MLRIPLALVVMLGFMNVYTHQCFVNDQDNMIAWSTTAPQHAFNLFDITTRMSSAYLRNVMFGDISFTCQHLLSPDYAAQ